MAGRSREPNPADDKPLWQRLGWLALIWACSVAVLGIVGYVLRLVLSAAGLHTP